MASTISAGTTAGTAVAITGDTSGNLALLTQNGANTITVPNGTGTMSVNGVSSNIVSGTAVASTSGTSIDFTGIPNWVKRVTVNFNGVSGSGSSDIVLQIGSGSVATSGYTSASTYFVGGAVTRSTTNFRLIQTGGTQAWSGAFTISLLNASTFIYSATGTFNDTTSNVIAIASGSATISGLMDRVRVTTANGTDTFDAGTINILYE